MPINARTAQRNFTGGEQSQNLNARNDLDRWRNSLAAMENFVVVPYGGAEKSPGTQFVREALPGSGLMPFAFSDADGFMVELGNLTARLFRDYGIVTLSDVDPTPYTFVTPFATGDNIYYDQANDVVFIASGARPIQKMIRVANTNWTVTAGAFDKGPFLDENKDDDCILTTTAVGELTKDTVFPVKSSKPVFSNDMIGGLLLIRENDGSRYGRWNAGSQNFFVGDIAREGDNCYKCIATHDDKTGVNPPVHLFGSQWDGGITTGDSDARLWLFLHSGYGVARITGYTDPSNVTVTALSYIPDEIQLWKDGGTAGGTNRWAEGAWSDKNGYPEVLEFHGDRLLAFFTAAEPNRMWGSCLDDFENFDEGAGEDDRGFKRTLIGNNKVNAVRWALSGQRLAIGTSGDEFVIQGSATREPLTPTNITVLPATDEGSGRIRPVKMWGQPVWASLDGRRLHMMGYDFSADAFAAPDLTEAAEHVTGTGITKMAWQREPYGILWATREDGQLIALTNRKAQDVNGWHRHPRSGRYRDVVVVPNPDGKNKDVWLKVERDLPGGTKTYVECMKRFFNRGTLDLTRAWFVDCGGVYDGAPVTEITGLDWLEGLEVAILADGQLHTRRVVTGGVVPLDRAASHVIVGLAYSGKLKSLSLARDFNKEAAEGRVVTVKSVTLNVLNSVGLKVAARDGTAELVKPTSGIDMNLPPRLTSGVQEKTPVEDFWDSEGSITVTSDDPFPATILSWTPNVQIATARAQG